ncbi:MAG: ATP synthase F1 subunit delta [Actinomycetota bacterium]
MARETDKVAEAILSIAEAQKNVLLVESELEEVSDEVASNMELKRYLGDKQVETADKIGVILSALGKDASKSIRAAVSMIIALGLQDKIRDIYRSYSEMADRLKKQLAVEVISAVKLDKGSVEKIKDRVDKKTGLDVRIKNIVEPAVIGGLIIRVGDLSIDLSTRGKLEAIKKDLKSIELEGDFFGA